MSDTILAVDLGRYKSVACAYSRATRDHAFHTLDTTPSAVDKLLAKHPGAVVVVEACANAGWVHDRAVAAEVFAKEEAKMRRKKLQRLEVMATSLNYRIVPIQ